MSTFRKHFRVTWDNGDPVDVVTSARDLAEANEFTDNVTMATFAMVHAALRRYGHNLPELGDWLDQLDELKATTNGSDNTRVDPTVPMDSTDVPSPYPS